MTLLATLVIQQPAYVRRFLHRRQTMTIKLLDLCNSARQLLKHEQGQDLVEYALVVAMMGFGATASVKSFATMLSVVISSISGNIAAS
jgi:pilus assembly protein Flp/PilA